MEEQQQSGRDATESGLETTPAENRPEEAGRAVPAQQETAAAAAEAAPGAAAGEGAVPAAAGVAAGMAAPAVRDARRRSNKKVLMGKVVSDKMQKTAVVLITRRKLHRLYKKTITESTKIKVHDEKNECRIGDTVRVIECRPLSKDKRWRLLEIVERAK